jgi:serine/threonine-protein kinase
MEPGSSETHAASLPSHSLPEHGFSPGTLLAGRYRIVALVGRGGMGEVYRADDLKLGQVVALKFLPAELDRDPAARERLLAEVRNARTVSHPNVCRVYDIGELVEPALSERPSMNSGRPEALDGRGESKGRAFLTMEYIDGEDLASLLRRIGRLPAPKALDVARQLCAGLAAAHDKGVLHRDLKPANVMIDGRGQARITDFGLAVETAREISPADAAGTVAYMAPERFAGKPASVQSDLYALGLVLYETYTGHSPFKAGTVGEWQRAHSSSTPETPSARLSDIEPAVERAILRCLEKEPAKRPASAAQVAAALPGGDPLAAAIAAGETPSPELVAASGEEGTLPRTKAWLWFLACLAALVAVPLTMIPFSLAEHVPMDLSPDALRARARDTLHELGYVESPADSAWWFRADDGSMDRLNRMKPSEALPHLRTAVPGPLRFCYLQGPAALTPPEAALVGAPVEPPPSPGDAYVELDLRGRLVTLRVMPAVSGDEKPAAGVNWPALFAAAHLGSPDGFTPVAPQLWPASAVDAREAREGLYEGQKVRVEAAARAGQPVFFRLVESGEAPPRLAETVANSRLPGPLLAIVLTFWPALIVLGVLARRNLRLGRCDRTAARRLAVAVVVAWTVALALGTHSTMAALDTFNGPGLLAQPLLFGLFTWVAYLGFEPYFRRAWPRLLIASTRLLDGRWRDPLVGRAVLAGVFVGTVFALPGSIAVLRGLDLPSGGPSVFAWGMFADGRLFVASRIMWLVLAAIETAMWLTVLLVARLAVRRADAAWAVFSVLMVGFGFLMLRVERPTTINPLLLLGAAGVFWLLLAWLLWKHGALALVVAFLVGALVDNGPWTLDMSRWYAWRSGFVLAVVAGLAFWGFRNVLGRQSVFPAGALDE